MAKHTLKILPCSHREIFKGCLAIFQHYEIKDFKESITWYLHWKKVTNKKLVKACRSILQKINKTQLRSG